jgi:hypothetical protein
MLTTAALAAALAADGAKTSPVLVTLHAPRPETAVANRTGRLEE